MKKIEYFCSPDFKDCFVKEEDIPQAKIITPDDTEVINNLLNRVESDYPEAYNRLHAIYGGMSYHKWRMACRFIKCNFGIFDTHVDQSADGSYTFEYIPCPLRGECKDENLICNPKFNTTLSARELEVMHYIVLNLTDEQIAERMFISKFTVNNHRRSILRKLNVGNKQGIADYALKHKL